ncbi:MAG: cobalt transporter [Lachnospiraceae bacterium]|nr:cobalt transporter [Lachnospiraceae bacterium]
MHLIHDENGNLCPHTHDHEHPHTHTYEHTHVHSHEHGHEEEHNHTHEHEHSPENSGCEKGCSGCGGHTHSHEAPQGDKMTALLDYMLKHNEHHAAELDQVAEKLRAEGKPAAAEQIKKAVDEFQKGNLYLSLALSMVKED